MRRAIITILVFLCTQSFGQNWLQNILDDYKDSVSSFGMVAIVDNGISMDTASIGVSSKNQLLSLKNSFCIGSCTKMYTATLVLLLHEQGLLNINDSIYHYLSKHDFIDSTITIKQLLNHTSGLADFTENGFVNTSLLMPYADYSYSSVVSRLDTIRFSKGERYEYCNTNYFLLHKIIEIASDKPYEYALQHYIFDPLKLKNTLPYYSNQIELLAHPIINGQDLNALPKLGINNISKGAGNIVSTPHDLNKFIRALFIDKTILKDSTLELMTDFYRYKNTKVGLGVFSESYGGKAVLGHTGRQISYISYLFIDEEERYSFVFLTNDANNSYIDDVVMRVCKKIK